MLRRVSSSAVLSFGLFEEVSNCEPSRIQQGYGAVNTDMMRLGDRLEVLQKQLRTVRAKITDFDARLGVLEQKHDLAIEKEVMRNIRVQEPSSHQHEITIVLIPGFTGSAGSAIVICWIERIMMHADLQII